MQLDIQYLIDFDFKNKTKIRKISTNANDVLSQLIPSVLINIVFNYLFEDIILDYKCEKGVYYANVRNYFELINNPTWRSSLTINTGIVSMNVLSGYDVNEYETIKMFCNYYMHNKYGLENYLDMYLQIANFLTADNDKPDAMIEFYQQPQHKHKYLAHLNEPNNFGVIQFIIHDEELFEETICICKLLYDTIPGL